MAEYRVVLARYVAAYISDWCRAGTGQTRKYSTMQSCPITMVPQLIYTERQIPKKQVAFLF